MHLTSLAVKNYKTLEEITLTFVPEYNAICGKNNSGKSNLVRAIRLLFGEKADRFPFSDDIEFSYKSDLCAWKKGENNKEKIIISGTITIKRKFDEGIVAFIESIDEEKTSLKKKQKEFDINVTIEALNENSKMHLTLLVVDGKTIEDKVVSQSIYDKLASAIVFHNSTMTNQFYFSRRRRLHGIFSKMPEANKRKVGEKAKALKKEVNKVFKETATELQSMLGRLGDKIEVKLDTPELDFEEYPYGISLGYKDFNIPLDDWGSGTRNQTLIIKNIFEAKTISTALAESERITPIVLIEEPESFLHPLAQAQFSSVLQALSQEWGIQVITSTHSPYLLSHVKPEANILLHRDQAKNKKHATTKQVQVTGADWKKPFEHALGTCGPEFDIFKDAFFSSSECLVMVEGETDKKYLELCKDPKHGKNTLLKGCQVFAYDGRDNLKNDVLIKFIRDRFSKLIITSDLDAEKNLCEKLKALGFIKNNNYFPLGIDSPGKRDIEGLIPDKIRHEVNSENQDLVDALRSDNKDESKKAKNELKKRYYEKFSSSYSIEKGDFSEFYKVIAKINKSLKQS